MNLLSITLHDGIFKPLIPIISFIINIVLIALFLFIVYHLISDRLTKGRFEPLSIIIYSTASLICIGAYFFFQNLLH